ncbi:cytochrome c oxidase subunit 3 [Sediminivirga luteola]|uniref:cytochrome-c oxidase n=1 Tax=Sediminivirga luteola TaxID=1774748 RepID=A0A8J2U090_9MICO|nr:heme-copper oxidase subunit III [Sediminivirga luteola]MCI2264036.1 heme-copper oxidase subunit III [Sediminivirga luteola]GGA22873.1 cytochrome b561 [Sediminivirga luteola]
MSTATASYSAPAQPSVKRPNATAIGCIVWLASELMFFAGLFAMYFTLRSVAPQLWEEESAKLVVPFALTITIILVLSSVTCQFGVAAAENHRPRRTGSIFNVAKWGMVEWFIASFILGAVFIAGQSYEYANLVMEGVTIASSSYGSAFYITTGFHGLHVVGGLIAFLFVIGRVYAAKNYGPKEETAAICVSYYWHFVDVVWIALFFIIYWLQ